MVLQILAIVGVIFVVTSEPPNLDDVSGALLVMFAGAIVICFGVGVGIVGGSLVKLEGNGWTAVGSLAKSLIGFDLHSRGLD